LFLTVGPRFTPSTGRTYAVPPHPLQPFLPGPGYAPVLMIQVVVPSLSQLEFTSPSCLLVDFFPRMFHDPLVLRKGRFLRGGYISYFPPPLRCLNLSYPSSSAYSCPMPFPPCSGSYRALLNHSPLFRSTLHAFSLFCAEPLEGLSGSTSRPSPLFFTNSALF